MLDRDRITQYFQTQFEVGESYASITVARKAIAENLEQTRILKARELLNRMGEGFGKDVMSIVKEFR